MVFHISAKLGMEDYYANGLYSSAFFGADTLFLKIIQLLLFAPYLYTEVYL